MPRFQRRANTLVPFEANRYEVVSQPPPGTFRGEIDGKVYVRTIQGRDVEISVGEWVIQEPDGQHYYPCSDEIFRERYEEVTS